MSCQSNVAVSIPVVNAASNLTMESLNSRRHDFGFFPIGVVPNETVLNRISALHICFVFHNNTMKGVEDQPVALVRRIHPDH